MKWLKETETSWNVKCQKQEQELFEFANLTSKKRTTPGALKKSKKLSFKFKMISEIFFAGIWHSHDHQRARNEMKCSLNLWTKTQQVSRWILKRQLLLTTRKLAKENNFFKSAIYNLSVLCHFKWRSIENFFVSSLFLDSISVEFSKKSESVMGQFEHAAKHDSLEVRQRT